MANNTHSIMKLAAVFICVLWTFFYEMIQGHGSVPLLDVCTSNDVMVDCVPSCPKICMTHLLIRKCKPIKCTRGCACKEGWVRKYSNTGICIKRSDCKRWIL